MENKVFYEEKAYLAQKFENQVIFSPKNAIFLAPKNMIFKSLAKKGLVTLSENRVISDLCSTRFIMKNYYDLETRKIRF